MVYEPKRSSLRLSSFDYHSVGAYFVTICAYKREPRFQDPILWHILNEHWHRLPRRFPTIALDEFAIMSDHVHFIIWLGAKEGEALPSLSRVVGAWKSLTAVEWLRHIKALGSGQYGKIWQERYYEHIIRDEHDLEVKRRYIRNNSLVARLKKEGEHN